MFKNSKGPRSATATERELKHHVLLLQGHRGGPFVGCRWLRRRARASDRGCWTCRMSLLETTCESLGPWVLDVYLASWSTTWLRATSRRCRDLFRRNLPVATEEFVFIESRTRPLDDVVEVAKGCWRVRLGEVAYLPSPKFKNKLFRDRRFVDLVVQDSAEIKFKFRSFVGLNFLFSDSRVVRSKLIIRRRDKEIFWIFFFDFYIIYYFLIFWFSNFLIFFSSYFFSK